MNGHALELRRAKGGGVAIDPVQAHIVRPPDTAIVAGVNDRRIGRCDANHVAINMQRIVAWCKCAAAISRKEKSPIQRADDIDVI